VIISKNNHKLPKVAENLTENYRKLLGSLPKLLGSSVFLVMDYYLVLVFISFFDFLVLILVMKNPTFSFLFSFCFLVLVFFRPY